MAGVLRWRRAVVGRERVVDEELVAGLHRLHRLEPQHHLARLVVLLDRLAVRLARMVQVARGVAALGAVDGLAGRQREQVGELVVPELGGDFLLAVAAAFVQAEEGFGRQVARGEGAQAMHAAGAHADEGGGRGSLGGLHERTGREESEEGVGWSVAVISIWRMTTVAPRAAIARCSALPSGSSTSRQRAPGRACASASSNAWAETSSGAAASSSACSGRAGGRRMA
ncbi:hypothetical protein FQZ97_940070 [compost metagenome]